MSEKHKNKKRNIKRLYFILISWALIFLLFEIAFRVIYPERIRPVYYGYPRGLQVPDSQLGHSLVPHFSGTFRNPRYSGIPLQTNGQGFRDKEWTVEKKASYRVLVLGDSITLGAGVTAPDRYTDVLENLLTHENAVVEVLNAGVNSYELTQYEILAGKLVPKYRPSLLLIGYCLNDIREADIQTLSKKQARYNQKNVDISFNWNDWLVKYRLVPSKSYLVHFFEESNRIRKMQSPEYLEKRRKKNEKWLRKLYENPDARANLIRHFGNLKHVASKNDCAIAVLLFPYRFQLPFENPVEQLMVKEVLNSLKIPYLDLWNSYRESSKVHGELDLYLYRDDCHPNINGHRVAAEQAAPLVQKLLTGSL